MVAVRGQVHDDRIIDDFEVQLMRRASSGVGGHGRRQPGCRRTKATAHRVGKRNGRRLRLESIEPLFEGDDMDNLAGDREKRALVSRKSRKSTAP